MTLACLLHCEPTLYIVFPAREGVAAPLYFAVTATQLSPHEARGSDDMGPVARRRVAAKLTVNK